jgi:hypothetical protein
VFSVIMPHFERPDLLRASLMAMEAKYIGVPFEVVIVDDVSAPRLKPIVPPSLSFDVTVVTLSQKTGINPCVPYNVGAKVAVGDYLVLTSPEIVPVRDVLLEAEQEFSEARTRNNTHPYVLFDVFGLTDKDIARNILRSSQQLSKTSTMEETLEDVSDKEPLFLKPGINLSQPWSNDFGSWYHHAKLKPSNLNFLSVIKRSDYLALGGFCERYRQGTGYDDLEFRNRMLRKLNLIQIQGLAAVHLDHEEVSSRPDINMPLNSNKKVFWSMKFLHLKPISNTHNFSISRFPKSAT